jgi:RNA polymerase sigma-70 factor (ECF subfamily)
MQRYRDGDATAFEPLYRRHRAGVYRHLLHGCGREAIAQELFHEVWIKVIRARGDWQPRARFATWLYRIAHNHLIDWWRSTTQGVEPLPDQADDDDAGPLPPALWAQARERPDEQVLNAERGDRIRAALAALPIEQRDAFLLHEEGGLTLEEIAEAAGVGRETIKSRLRYALAKLREALADVRA